MSRTFLVSDTHLGHKKILDFESEHRPFKDVDEHDAELIKRWNSVVNDYDLVYHLGDVAWNKVALGKLGQCRGKKILVAGNHDKFSTRDYLFYFDAVYGACKIEDYILTHIPIHLEEMRWKGNFHGHRHSLPQLVGPYCCVSMEKINLTPIVFEDAKLMLEANDAAVQ